MGLFFVDPHFVDFWFQFFLFVTGTPILIYIYIYIHTYIYIYTHIYMHHLYIPCGQGSSVAIATDYGLDGPGSKKKIPVGTRFSALQTGPGAHPASCNGSFPEVKCGRGVLLTTHPLLVPRSWKSSAIPLPTLWATPGL